MYCIRPRRVTILGDTTNKYSFFNMLASTIEHRHFKLYKPFGMLSQLGSNSFKQQSTKTFLSELHLFPDNCMPIGRLDEKSEGLLLMTTDGKFSDTINRSGVEKEYFAQLDGEITDEAIKHLRKGVQIGVEGRKYTTKPCAVDKLEKVPDLPPPHHKIRIGRHRPCSWVCITITEGKNRQIRKMTAATGFPTLRLVRVRIGAIRLNNLLPREVVPLSPSFPKI